MRENKERPVRRYITADGVMHVEWKCPACAGKGIQVTVGNGIQVTSQCTTCKGYGEVDGITKAIYEEQRL